MTANKDEQPVEYEPQEPCPPLTALLVGLQGAVLLLAPSVLIVTIAIRSTGFDDSYLAWAIFAALLINAVVTLLQARPVGRFGAGQIMIACPTAFFIGISAAAFGAAGPETLASLIVLCSVVQIAMARWLPALRRLLTPAVLGTVLILLAVTILPYAFDGVRMLSAERPSSAGPIISGATLLVAALVSLRETGRWRIVAPFISVVVGCLAALPFGALDLGRVGEAGWFGLPQIPALGFDLDPGAEFWALLPSFAILTFVQGTLVVSHSAVTQQASLRRARAVDFRAVQGAVSANGVGMLLAGIAGTPPVSYLSTAQASLIQQTGVASRRVGVAAALVFVALAFFAKLTALLLSIPAPVVAAYLMLALGLFFVQGIRSILEDGLDRKQAIVVTLSLTLGVGLHEHQIMTDLLGERFGGLAANGVMIGAVTAIVTTKIMDTLSARRARLETPLELDSLPALDEFLTALAARTGWSEASARRLRSAGEESLLCLLEQASDGGGEVPHLVLQARSQREVIALEFVAAPQGSNIQDRLALMPSDSALANTEQLSLRLLRHHATAVRHQQFHDLDVLTVQVEDRH